MSQTLEPPLVEPSLVERGRAALARHDWRQAFDLLSEADAEGDVAGRDLELFAQSAWWVGRLPDAIEIRERAYAGAVKAGDVQAAAVQAIRLARDNAFRMNESLVRAWLSRAVRHLEGQPEGRANGWLAAISAFSLGAENRLDEALVQASEGWEIGKRTGDHDLETIALSCRGLTLVYLGRVDEGVAALDEAAVVATAGELAPDVSGGVCCTVIGTSAILGDWQRAGAWTEAQDRWCRREHINGFPGMCRLYRAEAKRVRGNWLEAEAEARRATDELAGFLPAAVGMAFYEVGLIRLRRGDLPAAEEALNRAHSYNRDPEPARSLLRLAQGRIEDAKESIRRAIEEPPAAYSWAAPPSSDIYRISLLPAQVEIALAAGDVTLARRAADDLAALTGRFTSDATRAATAVAQGAVLAAEGDRAAAANLLRTAIDLWSQVDAPYEVGRARMLLAEVYAADGARDRATLEAQTARAAFERLGATLDLRRADALAASLAGDGTSPTASPSAASEVAVRTFVFTDIVDSTRLAALLGDAAWHDVIRSHDQTLRSVVAEHGGEEIKTVGDGFFLAFATTDDALAAAIAIQRRLAEHRQDHGFAPAVRIGMHRAEARRQGLDYLGTGVNVAARIGAQASGGEILVSAGTLADAHGSYAETGRRIAELKGVAQPVEVVGIDWR